MRNLSEAHTGSRFVSPPYRSVEEWNQRRQTLRRQILAAAGLWPDRPVHPYTPWSKRVLQRKSFAIDVVKLEPLPGLSVYGNLYIPEDSAEMHPAVLVPHGHWKHGRIHHAPDYSVPEFCANLASQGYVVFTWDMLGYNDTQQLPHEFGELSTEHLWSFTSLGIQLLDSISALDFVSSLPNVDKKRIAVTGASGGATQAILLAAVDDRISASVPVDMVSATFQGDDACELAPGLRFNTNNVEISALIAPKPLLLVSATGDWTKETPLNEFPMVESIYRLLGNVESVFNAHIESPHNYNRMSREAVYRFFSEHLRSTPLPEDQVREVELVDFDPKILLANPTLEERRNRYQEIFGYWRQWTQQAALQRSDPELKEILSVQIGTEWPESVSVIDSGNGYVLQRADSGDRVPIRWSPPSGGPVTIVVDSKGMERSLRTNRTPLPGMLYVDVFQTGLAKASRAHQRRDYLTFHRSDDANRVQDILTAIAFITSSNPAEIRLQCDSAASAWCVAAAAVSHRKVILDPDLQISRIDFENTLLIPGIERVGGIQTLNRLSRTDSILTTESLEGE